MQGKLTTDCDGSVEHEKWQEPAGTLSMALTAYITNTTTCELDVLPGMLLVEKWFGNNKGIEKVSQQAQSV